MTKKSINRRRARLWKAVEVWGIYYVPKCGSEFDEVHNYLVKPATKPLSGKSIRRLLGNGMYDRACHYDDGKVYSDDWLYADYPKFRDDHKYVVRIEPFDDGPYYYAKIVRVD